MAVRANAVLMMRNMQLSALATLNALDDQDVRECDGNAKNTTLINAESWGSNDTADPVLQAFTHMTRRFGDQLLRETRLQRDRDTCIYWRTMVMDATTSARMNIFFAQTDLTTANHILHCAGISWRIVGHTHSSTMQWMLTPQCLQMSIVVTQNKNQAGGTNGAEDQATQCMEWYPDPNVMCRITPGRKRDNAPSLPIDHTNADYEPDWHELAFVNHTLAPHVVLWWRSPLTWQFDILSLDHAHGHSFQTSTRAADVESTESMASVMASAAITITKVI